MVDKVDTSMIPDKEGANMSSYRAKRINALHRSVDDVVQQQNQKRLQISTEIGALTKEQQKLMQQIDAERGEFVNETAAGYNSVVKSLGNTIKNLSVGVKNITMSTAESIPKAIGQYSRAIGEDININKQNTIAMALSQATPLFGYFAAKFMETDVFKDSISKVKTSFGNAIGSVGEAIRGKFRKKKSADEFDDDIPKMQRGGYVKKGGLVEVHPAEVVMPVEKLTKEFAEEIKKDRQSIIETFINEYRNPPEEVTEWQDTLVKEITELKAALVGTADRMNVVWQRTLLQHPTLKAMITFGQTMHTVFTSPFKMLFSLRGGFAGDVRKATSSSNIFTQQVNLLSLIYGKGMTYLRNIDKYTKVTAEALTGQEVSPVTSKKYTLFGKVKEFMTTRKIKTGGGEGGAKEELIDKFANYAKIDREVLREYGINKLSDLLNPLALLRNMGITKENIKGKFKDKPPVDEAVEEVGDDVKRLVELKEAQEKREGPHSPSMAENIASTAKTTIKSFKEKVKEKKEKVKETNLFKRMTAKISETAEVTKKAYEISRDKHKGSQSKIKEKKTRERQLKEAKAQRRNSNQTLNKLDAIKSETRKQTGIFGKLQGFMQKSANKLKEWFPFLFSVVSTIASRLFTIGKWIGHIALLVAQFVGRKLLGGAGKILSGGAQAAGNLAGGVRGAYAGRGLKGVGSFMLRGGTKAAGVAAGATAGLVIGGGMSLWDIGKAMLTNPEGFVGNFIVRGLAAFLGGTSSGAKGASWGAMKGGALGTAIGAVGGPIGMLIGGAIGTIAGGILGFVGGGKISEALKNVFSGIKRMVKAVWAFVSFPLDMIKEVVKSGYYILSHYTKKLFKGIDKWLSESSIIGPIWKGIKNFFSFVIDKIKSFFGNLASAIPFDKIKGFFKAALAFITDPINSLLDIYKKIGEKIDEWLSNAPIIGEIYRAAKRVVKKVKAGGYSAEVKRGLEGAETPLLTNDQLEKFSIDQITQIYGATDQAYQKQLIDTYEKVAREKMKQDEEANKKASKERNATNKAINQVNYNISNSSNVRNVSNSRGGGGRSGRNAGVAYNVAAANFQ